MIICVCGKSFSGKSTISNELKKIYGDKMYFNNIDDKLDVDFGKIKVYPGNYDFWYESSQLALKQMRDANKKKEERIK